MVVGRRRRRVVRRHPGCELDPPVVVVASKKLQARTTREEDAWGWRSGHGWLCAVGQSTVGGVEPAVSEWVGGWCTGMELQVCRQSSRWSHFWRSSVVGRRGIGGGVGGVVVVVVVEVGLVDWSMLYPAVHKCWGVVVVVVLEG